MTIRICRVDDLTECLAIRHTVFVGEQSVPEDMEEDAHDATAIHLLACDGGVAIGTARIVLAGEAGKIGRVCILKSARGTGLGAALINAALEQLRVLPELKSAALGAQVAALPFYEKLGFVAYGPVFDDAGIPHQMMSRPL